MICKIEPANPRLLSAVEYNERKMNGAPGVREKDTTGEMAPIEDGHVLETMNVPEGSTLLEEFERLRVLALKKVGGSLKNITFHMSVNPSATDKELSEREMVDFVSEVMEDLGFGNQPYRIYKHTDIGRTHYHVVSTRCGQDGRKINDSFDWIVLRKSLKKLAPKYGFTVVLNEKEKEEERKKNLVEEQKQITPVMPVTNSDSVSPQETSSREEEEESTKNRDPKVPPFSRKSDRSVTQQISEAFNDAMKWNFSTFEQIQSLMLRRYNILIEVEKGNSEERLVVSGTNPSGNPITPILRDEDLGLDMMQRIREKCEKSNMSARKEQRKRLESLARAAAIKANSFEDFRELMLKNGPYVVLSWSRTGEPFGVTWLDRATKCAWKGSETEVDFKWLKSVAEEKGWTFTKDKQQETIDKRAAMPSRKTMITPIHVPVEPSSCKWPERFLKGLDIQKIPLPVTPVVSHQPEPSASHQTKAKDIFEESVREGEAEEKKEVKKQQKKQKNYSPTL